MTQPSGGAGAALSHSPASTHRETDPTPGMVRRVAVDTGSMWTGTAVTEPGMVSGWHHHGDHDSSIYVAAGVLHMEYGPGGSGSFDAVAGDVVHVPAAEVSACTAGPNIVEQQSGMQADLRDKRRSVVPPGKGSDRAAADVF